MKREDITVGFFLASRYFRGANPWTTILITFVMVLTFLNLTVIGGILEGIIVGSVVGLRDKAIGDVYISPKTGEAYVERTQHLIRELKDDARVKHLSPRYSARAEIIAENDIYNITNANEKRKSVATSILGVNPEAERATTNLPNSILEGEYFSTNNAGKELLIGSALLERYSPFGEEVLSGIYPGDFVYLRIGSNQTGQSELERRGDRSLLTSDQKAEGVLQKYRVKGVYRTKAGELDIAVITSGTEVRLSGSNPGNNVNSIAIRLADTNDSNAVRDDLLDAGFGKYAKIQTTGDAIGPFLDDIRSVFRLLGSVVGAIGLAVASITIFIIIFVTTAARSRFIGILKAIGITPNAIRISYIIYALVFAVIGITIGLAILYGILVPFFDANPIPFPFSDGILYTTPSGVITQIILLIVATAIAGLIPAHRVVRRPAIESIRDR